jgi:hypothetical protein
MLERSIRVSIESDYDQADENERYMSNTMNLDEMLILYVDLKIKGDFKETIKIDKEENRKKSQIYIDGSLDKLNHLKSDAIKLRITNYTNESKLIIDIINNKILQMDTIFEYRSSCTKCIKKVNSYENLMKKIDDYNLY